MKKKSLILSVVAVVAAAALGIGASLAYFTANDELTNTFTVGNITAHLEEGAMEDGEPVVYGMPDGMEVPELFAEDIEPTQTIVKAPYVVVEDESNAAYVMMRVSVPMAMVQLEGEEEILEMQELFTLNDISTDWTLIDTTEDTDNDVMVYTFVYNFIVDAGESTSPLFASVTFANVIEGTELPETISIGVEGFAVQTTGFTDEATVAENAENAFMATFGS